jgi:hypothetical protein
MKHHRDDRLAAVVAELRLFAELGAAVDTEHQLPSFSWTTAW